MACACGAVVTSCRSVSWRYRNRMLSFVRQKHKHDHSKVVFVTYYKLVDLKPIKHVFSLPTPPLYTLNCRGTITDSNQFQLIFSTGL